MSGIIYDHSQLSTALLPTKMSGGPAEVQQPGIVREGQGPAAAGGGGRREELALNSSSPGGLDSSRRSMNRSEGLRPQGDREIAFSGRGVEVELSQTGSHASRKSHRSRFDSTDGSDSDEDDSEKDEPDNLDNRMPSSPSGSQNQLIINDRNSFDDSTLPRLYNPELDSVVCRRDKNRTTWEEAALYVQEGEDDAKFYQHPSNRYSKLAYDVLHYMGYHVAHLLVTVLLMLLAFAETPALGQEFLDQHPEKKRTLITIHGILEVFFLSLLGLDLMLKAVWFGGKHFIKHKRSMLIAVVLAVMYVEAFTVLIRQENHIRITRALRPIFFIDTYYMGGVRRVLRQLIKSMKPILDVLILLIFFILMFSLIGYLLFAETDPDYFDSFSMSFISLFITHSTANNPDVMMESYAEKPATPIFYIIYLLITLYFASNVLLAVVYSSFSEADKKKFRKLFCHKREALHRAFHTLAVDPQSHEHKLGFHDFMLFMSYYRPRIPEWQVMCIFKALHSDPQDQYQREGLSLEEFNHFYEVIDYRWTELDRDGNKVKWFSQFPEAIKKPIRAIHLMVTNRIYKFLIGLVAFVNLLFLVVYASRIEDNSERFVRLHKVLPVSFTFLGLYIVDILLNIVGYGPKYFHKFWNLADLTMILVSLVCLCLETNPRYIFLAFLRPIKLVRLLRLKRRYRDLMNTMVALAPRLLSVTILIIIIYYAFSITGMEFLYDTVHQGCCNTSWYDADLYYSARVDPPLSPNDTNTPYVFFLNNFDNIYRSYVTLFILMVVNNWFIIMEGFASEVHTNHRWITRVYFLLFYIIMLVVVQVVISFMVEAFVTKIQAAQRRRNSAKTCKIHPYNFDCDCKRERKRKIGISLVEEDIAKLKYEKSYIRQRHREESFTLNRLVRICRRTNLDQYEDRERVDFEGKRDHTKEDIHILMYKDQFKTWIKIHKRQLAREAREQKVKKTAREMAKDFVKETAMSVMETFLE